MIMAIQFAGGLSLFLLSLACMSAALGRVIGPRTRASLSGASVPVAFATGLAATALVQSSTLVSVTLVGLVHAGAIGLGPGFAAVLGANVGTTVTAQIAGFRPAWLGWTAAALGAVLMALAVRERAGPRATSRAFGGVASFGFAGIVSGLSVMAGACRQAFDSDALKLVLAIASRDKVIAAAVGAAATAAVQSSALITALLVTLTREGLIQLPGAVALVVGSNVGTCMASLAASLPTGKEARALAWANIVFNTLGAAAVLPFAEPLSRLLALTSADPGVQLANAHALFNIITAAAILPFSRQFVSLFVGRSGERLSIDNTPSHRVRGHPGPY
jgi:phosphate:Na+ symporter